MNNEKNCFGNFLMKIEDFYQIYGKDVIINGVLKARIRTGDTVMINGIAYTVANMEDMVYRIVKSAEAGMRVGLLLQNADVANFKVGYDVTLVNAAEEIIDENEQKLDALRQAVDAVWDGDISGWELEEDWDKPGLYAIGEKNNENGDLMLFLGSNDKTHSGWIWIEYEPEKDLVGIYIKDRPIQAKFKEDIKALFEKHAPFGMKLSFERETTPLISKKETVEVEDLPKFFEEFRKAYNEYYPLFYMFTVSAQEWNEGFFVLSSYC